MPCGLGDSFPCVPAAKCIPQGGVPRVFPCNNHGLARADGTCQCDANEATGQGYTADLARFSYQGCFAPISCGVFGTVCNAMDACDPANIVALQKVPYFEGQLPTLLYLDGVPVTNESFISAADPNFAHQSSLRLQSLEQIALQVIAARDGLLACIDVFPGENCSSLYPVAMLHPSPSLCPSVYPYLKSFTQPYYLQPLNITYNNVTEPLLNDSLFFATAATLREGQQYVVFNNTLANASIFITFDQPYFITFVRFHQWVISGAARVSIAFPDGSQCQSPVSVTPAPTFVWQGPDGAAILCATTYQDFNFQATPLLVAQYQANCADATSAQCGTWQAQTCVQYGNFVPTPGNYYPGCKLQECCGIASVGPTGYYSNMTITVEMPTNPAPPLWSTWVDELQVYGYTSYALPVPAALQAYINQYIQETNCSDELFWDFASGMNTSLSLQDKQFFEPPQSANTWNSSLCTTYGGWTATNLDPLQDANNIAPFCTQGDCWVALKDRDEVPNPTLDLYVLPACTEYGCYTLNPTGPVDPSAVRPEVASYYQAGGHAADVESWQDFFGDDVGPNNQVATADNDCNFEFYLAKDCAMPGPDASTFSETACGAPCYYGPNAGDLSFLASGQCPAPCYLALPYQQSIPFVLNTDNGFTTPIYDGTVYSGESPPNRQYWAQRLTLLTDLEHLQAASPVSSQVPYFGFGAQIFNAQTYLDNGYGCPYSSVACQLGPISPGISLSIGVKGSNCQMAIFGTFQARTNPVPNLCPDGSLDSCPQFFSAIYHNDEYATSQMGTNINVNQFSFSNPDMLQRQSSFITGFWTTPPNAGQPYWADVVGQVGYNAPPTCFNVYPNQLNFFGFVAQLPVLFLQVDIRSPQGYLAARDETIMDLTTYPYMCSNVVISTLQNVFVQSDTLHWYLEWGIDISIFNNQFVVPPQPYSSPMPVQVKAGAPAFVLANLVNFDFSTVLAPCTFLPQCGQCELPQVASYQWDQYLYDPNANFFQTYFQPPPGQGLANPTIYVNWVSALGVNHTWASLQAIAAQSVNAYTNLSATLELYTLHVKWDHDYCVFVTIAGGFAQYVLDVCGNFHNVLCQHDTGKFQVQAGRQGDLCGSDSRTGGYADPNATCFKIFALGDPKQNPYPNMVADRFLNGTLPLLVQQNNTDYDAVYGFLYSSLETALFWAYPGAISLFQQGWSTRAIHPNPQGNPPSLNWLDFNYKALFPYTCPGRPCNPATGICRRRCAVSAEYCDPGAPQYQGPPMAADQYPAFMLALPNNTDFATTPSCGTIIYVNGYPYTDAYGPGFPLPNTLRLLNPLASGLKFQTLRTYGSLYNLAKTYYQFVLNQTVWLSGTITVNPCVSCLPYVVFWISPNSPLQDTSNKLVVYNLSLTQLSTDYVFSFVVPNDGQDYSALGFDVGGITPYYVFTVSNVLATSNTSILACQAQTWTQQLYEAPSSLDSGVPDNVCIFTVDQQRQYGAPGVGVCYCDPAFDGNACQYSALPLPYAPGRDLLQAACGGYGTGGVALGAAGELIPTVYPPGAYFDNGRYECKCRDIGKVIRTTFTPETAFAYVFVERYDVPYGVREFLDFLAFIASSSAINFCGSYGATLPSWVIPNDLVNFLQVWQGNPVVMDFGMLDALTWGWVQAQSPVNISAAAPYSPCPATQGCAALNWNNLAYLRTANILTDGVLTTTLGGVTAIVFSLLQYTGTNWQLVLWPSIGTGTVTFTPLGTCGFPSSNGITTTLFCSGNVSSINVTFTATQSIAEIQVYSDGGRI